MEPKQRLQTFNSRKEILNKRLNQLTTLCDINACMIIYEPTLNRSFVWPEDKPETLRRLIGAYKAKSRDENIAKRSGVSDFLEERKRKAKAKYPTWNELYDSMNESQLRCLRAALDHKARIVGSRIQMMKMDAEMKEKEHYLTMLQNSANYHNSDTMNMNYTIHSPPQSYYYAPQPLQIVPPTLTLQYYTTMDPNIHYSGNNAEAEPQHD